MVKGLKVGDEVVWVVGNIIKGRREERRFDVVILASPDRNNAQIECALNGKPYKVTVKRSHLEPKGAPQKAVSRALNAALNSTPARGHSLKARAGQLPPATPTPSCSKDSTSRATRASKRGLGK